MNPRTLLCLLLAVLLPAVAFCQTTAAKPVPAAPAAKPAPPPIPPPLAKVNEGPVSQGNVDQAIANRWAGPIMRAIIEDRLIRQEARRQGLKATPEEVQARYRAARDKHSSDQAFERSLLSQGFTTNGFVEKLTSDILLDKLLAGLSAVSEEEARKYYTSHQAEYASPAQINLFTITTTTIEDAYLVRERLASGDKFETVAKELSQDGFKDKGGERGWITADAISEKVLSDALFAMEPGVVSSPLRSEGKFLIALVKERKAEQVVTYEQARKAIVGKLQDERTLSRADYLRVLARKATISVDWAPARFLTAEYAALRQIQVVVDDEPLALSDPPVRLANGTILVPAKPVLQAVGARLDWQAKDQSLTASTPTGKVKLVVGQPKAVVGLTTLEAKDMVQPPVMRNGVLYIAPRVALAALGATLNWNAVLNSLVIESADEEVPSPTVPVNRSGLEKQP